MKKSKSKKIKGRKKIFIIGAYWILFVALMGIFSSSIFKYSADAPAGYTDIAKTIKPSVLVAEKGSENGVASKNIGISVDLKEQINGKTGSSGYSNEGEFGLVQKGDSVYITHENAIVKTLYFYLTDANQKKADNKQVTMNVAPLITKDKLENLIPASNEKVYRLPTVTLYPDGSGGSVVGFTAANGANNGAGDNGGGSSAVGVGVPIPAPGSPNDGIDNAESYTYNGYMCALYYWALNIGFGLTLLMFVYAGYRYMTAAGNDSVFTETKDVLTNAILGFMLLLCIRLVLHFLHVPEPDSCFEKKSKSNNTTTIVQPYALDINDFEIV